MLVGLRAGEVYLIQHRDNGEVMVYCHIKVRQRLRFNTLCSINKKHGTFTGRE